MGRRTGTITAGLAIGGVLLALTGCSGGGPSDDPAKSAEDFLHALANDDAEAACELMADEDNGPADPDSADWNTCVQEVGAAIADRGLGSFGIAPANLPDEGISAYADAEVTGADINKDGQRAEVEREMISGVEDNRLEISLVKFDGRWYVTDVDEETG